tara:strand:+ start:315 stop:560 length:246 start_codon:yes stop_codon:yes gene_type:complete
VPNPGSYLREKSELWVRNGQLEELEIGIDTYLVIDLDLNELKRRRMEIWYANFLKEIRVFAVMRPVNQVNCLEHGSIPICA